MAYDKLITNSSSVARIQYSPDSKVLRITYNNGATFDYADVPETIWRGLDQAASVGSYVAAHVKGNYKFKKVA